MARSSQTAWRGGWALALAMFVSGCGAGTAAAATNAAINTAIAVGASAVRRSRGDCFVPCDHGTECNPETGFCEPLPCGGECSYGERCDTTRPLPRCVPEVPALIRDE